MANILLLHQGVYGHTRRICERLQTELATQRHSADLVALDEAIDLTRYDMIVLGASIRHGKHNPAVMAFIRTHQALLESRPSAFFSVSLVARKPAKIEAREPREPREARVDPLAVTGEEIALEGPARVLVRTEGNTEHVHVLARRTRIGRGSDNELVLDTKHVSRYHCVLLAGPVHTSIEDLNSTNGVFVNNKRIARHILKDGDRVTVGRTQFRYTVRD